MVKKLVAHYLRDKLTAKSMVSQSFIEESIHLQIVDKLPANYPSWSVASAAGELYGLLVDVGMVELLVINHLIKRLEPLTNIECTIFYMEAYNLVVDILPPGCLSEDVAAAASKLYGLLLNASREGKKVLKHQRYLDYKAKKKLKEDK